MAADLGDVVAEVFPLAECARYAESEFSNSAHKRPLRRGGRGEESEIAAGVGLILRCPS